LSAVLGGGIRNSKGRSCSPPSTIQLHPHHTPPSHIYAPDIGLFVALRILVLVCLLRNRNAESKKRKKGRSCDQLDNLTLARLSSQPPVRCLLCTLQLVFSSLCRFVQPPHTPTRSRGTHPSSVSVPI